MSNLHYANEVAFQNFKHLEVKVVPEQNAVWLYFDSQPRACFTLTLLQELDEFQSILKNRNGKLPHEGKLIDIEFNVITSRHPVFSFGGDLEHFIKCIEKRDRENLRNYAKYCINAVYFNNVGRELGLTTISLIHGSALGGGFEAALSSNVLIAERQAELGFPEVLFNLFPGMGAYNLLAQRVNLSMVEKIMLSGRLYSAEELHDIGIIDVLVEEGEGEAAVGSYIRSNRNRLHSLRAIRKIRDCVNPLNYQQLIDIGDIWVETAMNLSEKEIRVMSRLVNSQIKFSNYNSSVIASHAVSY
ncbi:MAG: crotonase/enoyl-CoA hydratase family protein [Gammaproteobacteria bacterium]